MMLNYGKRIAFSLVLFLCLPSSQNIVLLKLGAASAFALEENQRPHSSHGEKSLATARQHLIAQNTQDAVSELSKIISAPNKYRAIDVAVAYQFRGYAHALIPQNLTLALNDLTMAMTHEALPTTKKHEVINRIALLYASARQYTHARDHLNMWLNHPGSKPREYYRLSAFIHVMLGDHQNAYNDLLNSYRNIEANYPGDLSQQIQNIVNKNENERDIKFQQLMTDLAAMTPKQMPPEPHRTLKPDYPTKAAKNKLNGYVLVGFDIQPDGNVTNVEILEAIPEGIFEKSIIKTVSQWEFKTKIVKGVAIAQDDIVYQIVFNLLDLGHRKTSQMFRVSASWHDCLENAISTNFCPN